MPIWGEQKKRDMARSILPSTKKRSDKMRREIHKSARVQERILLAHTPDGEAWLEEGPDFEGVERARNLETRNFVDIRRSSDKVGPFIRWAEQRTKDLPTEDRLSYLKGVLPDSLIGEHAVSHLKWNDHFRDPSNNHFFYRAPKSSGKSNREVLMDQLREEVLTGGQKELNLKIKQAHRNRLKHYADSRVVALGTTAPRTLRGIHDNEDFVRDIYDATRSSHSIVVRENLNPKYHHELFGEPGVFHIYTAGYHPEWIEAVQGYFAEKQVSRSAS